MNPCVLLLVTVVSVTGGWTLAENEWRRAINNFHADFTRHTLDHPAPDFEVSEKFLRLAPGEKPVTHNDLVTKVLPPVIQFARQHPYLIYTGFMELLDHGDNMALASYVFFNETDGFRTGTGPNWFQIENGKVKLKLLIYNYDQ